MVAVTPLPSVELFNPLPAALHHYELALRTSLESAFSVTTTEVSIERGQGALPARLLRQLRARIARVGSDPLVVLWPALGEWDVATWALTATSRPVWVVLHDPEPLRHQYGTGRSAAGAVRLGRGSRARVLVHSTVAESSARGRGWHPVLVPHPVGRAPQQMAAGRGSDVLVLGQYKPARDLRVLAELAGAAAIDGARVIHGRGWPPVAGWTVSNRFLTEQQFSETLGRARCLVLPYAQYFQSGVAVRAVEQGVPVVADRHPFLEELLGPRWPGFVGEDGWARAVERVDQVSSAAVDSLAARARARADQSWHALLISGRADRRQGLSQRSASEGSD